MAAPSVADFRAAFPEFGSTVKYPDPLVQLWLTFSSQLVNEARWGDLAPMGMMLATAHRLVIATKNSAAAAQNLAPGAITGALSSKSADGLSASYEVSTVTEEGAGQWNATNYGTQYYQLMRMMGAGPIQSGMPSAGEMSATLPAWPGVIPPII